MNVRPLHQDATLEEIRQYLLELDAFLQQYMVGSFADAQSAEEGLAAVRQTIDDHTKRKDNPHEVTAQQVGAYPAGSKVADSERLNGQPASYYTNIPARLGYTPVNKAGDTMTGPLKVGDLVIRKLGDRTGSSPVWWKLARIQNQNPIGGSEATSFAGLLIVQSDFGNTANDQGIYVFSFGSRGGTIIPIMVTLGNARPTGNYSPRFQVWEDSSGWHYLYFQQPRYSRFCTFFYAFSGDQEYWVQEDPSQVDGLTLVWDSSTGSSQDIYIGANKVWHAGNDGAGSGLDADMLDGQHGSYYAKASDLDAHKSSGDHDSRYWRKSEFSLSTGASANTVAQRDSNGDLTARVLKPTQYLQLPVLSSDPSSPPNGAIWLRS